MLTLIITNNSAANFRFTRRATRKNPIIAAGATVKIEDLTEADLAIWREQLEVLRASADFDVVLIDDLRRTVLADGNLTLSNALKIGTAAKPFAHVKVEGNLLMTNGEACDLYCDTLDVTGYISLWGSGTTRVRRCCVDGNLTCVGGTHTMSDVFVDGDLITNGGTLNAKRVHVDGAFNCGAAGTANLDNVHVTGATTVTAGGAVNTKDARLIGALTGTVTNADPVTIP